MTGLPLIVDFLNTVDERTFRRHGEHHSATDALTSSSALADWLDEHDLVAGDAVGASDLRAARGLRTALRAALLEESAATTVLSRYPLQLEADPDGGLRLALRSGPAWSAPLVETVANSVARGDWARVKLCAAADCHWAFHDTSRNGRGRWCEMGVCGNRHKTRSYRERRHAEVEPG